MSIPDSVPQETLMSSPVSTLFPGSPQPGAQSHFHKCPVNGIVWTANKPGVKG